MTQETDVPLSVEILENVGFKNIGSGYYNKDLFVYLPGSPQSDYGFGIKGIGFIRSIKYLHQLENLHYAIYDEPLTYNRNR